MESVNNHTVVTEEAQPQTEQTPEPSSAPASPASSEAAAPGPAPDYAAERERLNREKSELQDLLQRRQAEFENYRKRSERERGEIFDIAAMHTIRALLAALDNFERVLKHKTTDKEDSRGIVLIYQRLMEALKKFVL